MEDDDFKEYLENNKKELELNKLVSKIENSLGESRSLFIKGKMYRPMKKKRTRYDKKKDHIQITTMQREHDFLKFYAVVKHWACFEFNLKAEELELLLYFYSEPIFTRREFNTYSKAILLKAKKIERFIENGLIEEAPGNEKIVKSLDKVYKLTFKCLRRINAVYKKLTLAEQIDTDSKNNRMFVDSATTYREKNMRQLIIDMNKRRADIINGNNLNYLDDDIKREEG